MSKLIVDVRVGEKLIIGDTVVSLASKSGQLARLVVEARPDIKIITPKKQRMSAEPLKKEEGTHGEHPIRQR